MDKEQAKRIIKDTFETSFNEEKFIYFIMNLLNLKQNDIENTSFGVRQGYNIPEMFRPYISRFKRVAKYLKDNNRIDILIVHLKKDTSIERARSRQRNFIAGYLKGNYGSDKSKDAALVAFVSPNEADWRFSLVKMDYRFEEGKSGKIKVREEFTPVRRWSFLVGKNESSHTAQSRLVHILADDQYNPTFTQLEEAFNIEKVTKEFFLKYRNLFLRIKEELDKVVENDLKVKKDFAEKGVDTVNFAKKFLGQIVFLYFLQKKGWFGVERDDEWGTGPKDFLRQLFNKEYGNYKNFFNDILEPLFYEALARERDDNFYSRFNCKIPFLNGGLFEPIGGYDWVHTDINISNKLFSNRNDNYEGNGVLDIFDLFNFTVKEDEPLEKEVAIDPELLGKTYEKFNAIRPDNYEEYKKALKSGRKGEENKFNKKFGVYYTPREIVHYMCQESLINYLHIVVNQELMRQPVRAPKQIKLIGPKEPEQLGFHTDKEIVDKKAIEELIKYGEQFTENEAIALIKEQNIEEGKQKSSKTKPQLPESIRKNAKLIDVKLADIRVCDPAVGSGAFPVGMMAEIVKARRVLSVYIKEQNRTPYSFKRECIEKSLYGVDIDPGAVEIAKLRLWLSLIVNEEDITKIKPLPNLDYKIVCGNSLLGVERDLFNNELFSQLELLKPLYFNETNPIKKQEYKKRIDELINKITNGHKDFDFEVYFSEVFHEKKGFDVVIANPPYININEMKKNASVFRKQFNTAYGSYDIYVLFFEKSIQVLRVNGILTFITSNKFFISDYAKRLRALIISNAVILKLLDLADCKKVFEALVSPAVSILRKQKMSDYELNLAILKDDDIHKLDNIIFSKIKVQQLSENLEGSFNIYINSSNQKIMTKLKDSSVKLVDLANVRTGIMGFEYWNMEPFIRDVKQDSKSIRIITNSHLERYRFLFGKKINLYKKIYRNPYLDMKNAPLNKTTKEFFLCTKIIVRGVAKRLTAQIDKFGYATLVAVHGIYNNNKNIEKNYILALLNSALFNWLHLTTFYTARIPKGSLRYPISFLKNLPIKKISESEQKPFVELVNLIIINTQSEDYLENRGKQTKAKEYERQIDQMVYKLYGLTEEEIKIIEKENI